MKLNLTVLDLSLLLESKISVGNSTKSIHTICTDTRHTVDAENTLFIPLIGEHFNGHAFVGSAYKKGIRTFIVSENVLIYLININRNEYIKQCFPTGLI